MIDKEATCSVEGKHHGICSMCGEMVSENIPTLPHTTGEWNLIQAATCYGNGREERVCSVCGDKESRTIEQLTHEYSEWIVVSGSKLIPPIVKEKTCAHCADVQSVQDWSYVWVTIIAVVALIGISIGVINYIKAFKKK